MLFLKDRRAKVYTVRSMTAREEKKEEGHSFSPAHGFTVHCMHVKDESIVQARHREMTMVHAYACNPVQMCRWEEELTT